MRTIHGPICRRPAATSAREARLGLGPHLEVVVDHDGLAVEQEPRVRRGRARGGRAGRRRGARAGPGSAWNGAYHSRSQCVWGTIDTRLRATSRCRLRGIADRARAVGMAVGTLGAMAAARPRSRAHVGVPRLRRHHHARSDVGVHLLERAAPRGEWWELARAVRAGRDRQPRSASSTSGRWSRATRRCSAAIAAEVAARPRLRAARRRAARRRRRDDGGVRRVRLLRARRRAHRSGSTCSRTTSTSRPGSCCSRTRTAAARARRAACASRRRSRTRSTAGRPRCSSVTARATARPRCWPTSCSPRGRSRRGAGPSDVDVHPVRHARRRAGRAVRRPAMKIAFGSDERTPLTDAVRADLEARGHTVVPVGPLAASDDDARSSGPRSGTTWGELVANGGADTGVLFCWTGTGASIAANKVRGVRAALCTDAATAAGRAQVERRQRAGDGPAPHQPRARARDARRLVRHEPGTRAKRRTSPGSSPDSSRPAPLRERQRVAGRVTEECHPLFVAGGAELAGVVADGRGGEAARTPRHGPRARREPR